MDMAFFKLRRILARLLCQAFLCAAISLQEAFFMSHSLSRPAALTGIGFLLLTLLKSLGLAQGSPTARLAVGLCLLALAAFSLWPLHRAGISRSSLLFLLLPIGLSLFLRILLLDHATLDYQDFLSRWVEHFRQNGGVAALKDPVGNYNVPYLYLLALLSYLPFPDLYGIKLFSILFDFLLAWGGFRLARSLSNSSYGPLLSFSILLLLPTVILNGACWGQCDSVWAALCVHSLAYALKDRPIASLALLSLAFSFKLQAIFIIPLWCALWLAGKIKFSHLFVFPGVFALSMAPALMAGKPIKDILSVYWNQAGDSVSWQTVNYNSPSVFSLLPYRSQPAPWVPKTAILLAFLFMLGILAFLFLRKDRLSALTLTLAGAALSLGIPFLLPYMHERYFFLGGVLLVILACNHPPLTPAAVGAELASLGGYHAYLLKRYALVLSFSGVTWTQPIEGLLMLLALCSTVYFMHKSTLILNRETPQEL